MIDTIGSYDNIDLNKKDKGQMIKQIGNGKASGLIEFLDFLVEKEIATRGAVKPLKSAVRQVLVTVDGDQSWLQTNIKNLDIENYMTLFKNQSRGKYSATSYISYQSRLIKAKDWYINFLENPNWSPPQSTDKRKYALSTESMDEKNLHASTNTAGQVCEAKPAYGGDRNQLISHPFVLLDGTIVSLYLPPFLKTADAKRLGRFIDSLSIDADNERKELHV